MDAEGIDIAVLFPTRGLFVLGLDTPQQMGTDGLEPDFAAAIARAYNDWMRDFCAEHPTRMFGCGMVAPHDVGQAVAEARRCVEELGFKAVFLSPGTVNRKPWHHRDYDPLWAECERLNVPICFHGGGQNFLKPDFSLEVLDKLMMWHTFSQPLGIMTDAGQPHRRRRLRALPDAARRAAGGQLLVGAVAALPARRALRVARRLRGAGAAHEAVGVLPCATASSPSRPTRRRSASTSSTFGDDNLVYSTDYPHADSKFPHAVEAFTKLPLSAASQKKILWDNFSRLYDLEAPQRRQPIIDTSTRGRIAPPGRWIAVFSAVRPWRTSS